MFLASAPDTSSTLATAIISRAIMKSGGAFHVSFESPIMGLDKVNELRTKHSLATVILVGIDTMGKKTLRKGKSYPIFIGGSSKSEKVKSQTLGNSNTISAAAYVLTEEHFSPSDYGLQLASGATLLSEEHSESSTKANMELVQQAREKKLIEERKGFRLFGFGFLPLDELLLYNTRPFIQGISGNQSACDLLLNEAEIPITKLRTPMSSLSNAETQHLTQHLTSKLLDKIGPSVISEILGTDYVLTLESETSPLRYLSGLEAISETTWARQEMGAALSVWIGDRGRSLRTLLDTYLSHHKEVISTIQRLETKLKGVSTEAGTAIEISSIKDELMTDVGRIALQTGIVDQDRPLIISNDTSSIVTWTAKNVDMNHVLTLLLEKNLEPITTSSKSIKLKELAQGLRIDVLESVSTIIAKGESS